MHSLQPSNPPSTAISARQGTFPRRHSSISSTVQCQHKGNAAVCALFSRHPFKYNPFRPAQAIVEQYFSKPFYEWYTTTPKGESPDLQAALDYLGQLNRKYGPYQGKGTLEYTACGAVTGDTVLGIAGFSQGGRLAAMVASLAARGVPGTCLNVIPW